MKKNYALKTFLIFAMLTTSAITFMSCSLPTFEGDSRHLEEVHSVWQYLSVFSIFQDRIPNETESFFMSPEEMMRNINDTLKGGNYTRYFVPPPPRQPGGGGGGSGQPIIPPDTVIAITDETVYFRFRSFDNLSINMFRENVTYMSEFDNIIIDVRQNGGGLLNVVTEMVSQFLPLNTDFIRYHRRVYDRRARVGKDVEEIDRAHLHNPQLTGKKVVILANGNSASASEILVSALVDRANATFLGSTTYGKAIGQSNISRGDRPMLIITSMEIRGVTERTGEYHIRGIAPDDINEEYVIEAENDLEELNAPLYELFQSDAQLYYAIRTAQPDVIDLTNEESQVILDEFIDFALEWPWLIIRYATKSQDGSEEFLPDAFIVETIYDNLFD